MVHLPQEWNFGTQTTLPSPATPPRYDVFLVMTFLNYICIQCFLLQKNCNLSKIGPPSKVSSPPFLMKLLQRMFFSWKYTNQFMQQYCYVKQRSSTVQLEGLTNEGRHDFLLLHKQVQVKISKNHCMHTLAYFWKKKITSRKYAHNSWKYVHPPLSEAT